MVKYSSEDGVSAWIVVQMHNERIRAPLNDEIWLLWLLAIGRTNFSLVELLAIHDYELLQYIL